MFRIVPYDPLRRLVLYYSVRFSMVPHFPADLEKVESLPPADLHFQLSAWVKFQIKAFFLDFSASTARLLDTFSMSVDVPYWN